MKRLNAALKLRLSALATTNRKLRRDIARHAGIEAVLRKRSERYAKLWNESRILQQDLRALTQRMLRAQEDQRLHLSRELQDVIAQTLLGIHIKMLALRREAQSASRGVRSGLSSTQRMVLNSGKTVNKATKALGRP